MEKEIIEKDIIYEQVKSVALFMEAEDTGRFDQWGRSMFKLPTKNFDFIYIAVEDMLYQDDWNWIMAVVEKIESIGFRVMILKSVCDICPEVWDSQNIVESTGINKTDATFQAVVEFIKWWNENKQ